MNAADSISVGEASRMLHAEPHFVLALLLRGELRAVGPGPTILVSRSAIQKYLRTHPLPTGNQTRDERESIVYT